MDLHRHFNLQEDAATDHDLRKGQVSQTAPCGGGCPTKQGVHQHDIGISDDDCIHPPTSHNMHQHDIEGHSDDIEDYFDADFAANFDVDKLVHDVQQCL